MTVIWGNRNITAVFPAERGENAYNKGKIMKRIFTSLLCFALAVTLGACGKRENSGNSDDKTAEYADVNAAYAAAAFIPEPVFLEDIHEFEDGNKLYNINDTYIDKRRFNADFSVISSSAELWRGVRNAPALPEEYDRAAAVQYAKAHWNDEQGLCAEFASRCLNAGGLSISSDSSSALALLLLNSRLGCGEFVAVSGDRTVRLPDYAEPGDVVELFCPYEGLMIHSTIFVGTDKLGNMKVCCHNEENSGEYTYLVAESCKSCGAAIKEIFFYHFGKNPGKDSSVLLFENAGYAIENQSYNAAKAVKYARENPADGVGQFGAKHTSQALAEGGLRIGYPVQTALFFQLMKSRLGEMRSIAINPDRTVTLPESAKEGDVCFLYCPREGLIYSSFLIKGADSGSKMLAYSHDKINNDTAPFRVESVCPGSKCGGEIRDAVLFTFD